MIRMAVLIHVAPTVSVPGLHLCSRMVVHASFSTPSHSILATVSHTCTRHT